MLFDTHVHFDPSDGQTGAGNEVQNIIRRAMEAGVSRMLAIGGSPSANRQAIALARQYPGQIRAAAALERGRMFDPMELREITSMIPAPEITAIGETGLDFHHDRRDDQGQRIQFQNMLALARAKGLPVIVHSRDAEIETLEALSAHAAAWPGSKDAIGVLHCFTGTPEYARRLLQLGFHISFSGIVTFKNAGVIRDAVMIVPDNRLLLETDAPFLAPEPYRGRRNEPAYLPKIAECLAQLRNQTPEHIASCSTDNATRLFM